MSQRLSAISALLLAIGLSCAFPTPANAEEYELRYEVRVRIRSLRLDADLWSGGRLALASVNDASGVSTLRLSRVLEHPWKFWWVSPLIGSSEVKYAEEVTLDAGTWASRRVAEQAVRSRSRLRWERWRREWGGDAELDQAFSFHLIGDPSGRWLTRIGQAGEVLSVTNRLTHRWLPTGFADWLEGRPQEGYGFWADDPEPPEWEPHAYHAFADALRLLEVPALPFERSRPADESIRHDRSLPSPGDEWEVRHPNLPNAARRVLETLAPATKGRFDVSGTAVLRFRAEDGPNGRLVVRGESPLTRVPGKERFEHRSRRELVIDRATGRVLADELQVEIRRGEQASLEIEVARIPR